MSTKQYRDNNKEQIKAQNKKWRDANKEKIKSSHEITKESRSIKAKERKYGITVEQFNTLVDKQKSLCAICGIHSDETKIGLYVDHCHISGDIRGLLCQKCNNALGLFNDSLALVKRATYYLENYTDARSISTKGTINPE
jgi:predicted restriction endonuclease